MTSAATACWLACAALDLPGAIAEARQGRFVEALLAAETESDPALRAEASLYVRHHAGDLDGALRVAEDARRGGVATAWLEEREAFVALSLRDVQRARTALDALARRPDGGGADIAALAAAHALESSNVERTLAARDGGIARARGLVRSAAALALALGVILALRADRARPSP